MGLFPDTKAFADGIAVLNTVQPPSDLDAVLKRIINCMIQDDGRQQQQQQSANSAAELSCEEMRRLQEHLELRAEDEVDSALACLSQIMESCVRGVAKPPAVHARLSEAGLKEGHALHLAQKWAENARPLVTAAAATRKRTGAKGNVASDGLNESASDELGGENSAERDQDKPENLSR